MPHSLLFIPVPASEYGVNTLLRFIHMISLANVQRFSRGAS